MRNFKQSYFIIFKSDEKSFVTINRLDKEGFYISITKNRYNLVKDELLKSHLIIDDKLLLFKDFSIKTQTNSVKISCALTDDISDKYVHNLKKIVEINKLVFKEKLVEFEKKFSTLLSELVVFIAEVDLTVSNIKTSKKYNYTCPKIVKTKDDENFLELIELRHPIIEANEDRGVYVTNDIGYLYIKVPKATSDLKVA